MKDSKLKDLMSVVSGKIVRYENQTKTNIVLSKLAEGELDCLKWIQEELDRLIKTTNLNQHGELQNINKQIDEVVSKKLMEEVARIIEPAYKMLKEKGWVRHSGEGCAADCRELFGWIGKHIHGGKLNEGLFDEDRIDKLGGHNADIIRDKKQKLMKKMLEEPKDVGEEKDKEVWKKRLTFYDKFCIIYSK